MSDLFAPRAGYCELFFCRSFMQSSLSVGMFACQATSRSAYKSIDFVVFSNCAAFRKEHHALIGALPDVEMFDAQEARLRRLLCSAVIVYSVCFVQLRVVAGGNVIAVRHFH